MRSTPLTLACLSALLLIPSAARAAEDGTGERYARAFDDVVTLIEERYAYLAESRLDLVRVREIYGPMAQRAPDDEAFVRVLKDVVDEMHDHHAGAWPNAADDRRLVPSTTDLWADWNDDRAVITAVRAGSAAGEHGFRPGMVIESIDGTPVAEAVSREEPLATRAPTAWSRGWALRVALSGRIDAPVRVVAADEHGRVDATFSPGRFSRPRGPLHAERLPGGAGYIRFNNSLGNNETIHAFDAALDELRNAPGLILDLRDTPGGGNTTVARGVLGRLTSKKRVYQTHALPLELRAFGVERSWAEFVSPRGPFAYEGRVVVLVGRWTGSMGEGMTLGLDAFGATVIGGPMARLRGATSQYQLDEVEAWVSLPTETLFHADGTPREEYVPGVRAKENGEPFGSPRDEAFQMAVELLSPSSRP